MSTTKRSKKKEPSAKPTRLSADDIFNLMDFDSDGKITVNELKEAVLACGVPADRVDIQTFSDYYLQTSGGKIDLKAFKTICRELKPDYTNAQEFYSQQFKTLSIDQDGLLDIDTFRDLLKNMGQKLSDTNINIFLKQVRKEEGNKVKVSSIVDKLASLNILA